MQSIGSDQQISQRGFSYLGPTSEVRVLRESDMGFPAQRADGKGGTATKKLTIPVHLTDFQKNNIGAMKTIIDLERERKYEDDFKKQDKHERFSGKSNKSNLYNFQLDVVHEEDHNVVETVVNKEPSLGTGPGSRKVSGMNVQESARGYVS